eukprot:358627_1
MSEEKEAINCKQTPLWIGSWNVHNWYDGKGKPNGDRMIKALQETPVDIIGFQEAMKGVYSNIDCLSKLKNDLQYNQLSTDKNNIGFYQGVVLASKYDIIESFQVTNRLQLNIIKYTKDILLGIIVIHFDYRDEKIRINEYNKILKVIQRYEKLLPMIFIGDFNALTKSDYTENEWNHITKIRKDNQWELPKTELLEMIKKDNYFYDALYMFQQEIKMKNNRKQNDKNEQKIEKEEKNNDKIINEMKSNDEDNCERLNGVKWNNILGNDNLGTCSFDTRIDYVLINEKMLKLFEIEEYQHLAHNDASDHKLVRVRFKLRE